MKKFCFLVLFIFTGMCFASSAKAVNRADSTDHLRVPKTNLYKVAYGDEDCRKALIVLPVKDRTGFSVFSKNSQAGSVVQLRGTGQINPNINIGICFEDGEDLKGSYNKQTIGLDLTFWKDKFAIGTVLPLQGNDADISLRHTERTDDLSATSFITYRTKGVWDFGLDVNWQPIKIEVAYNDEKEFAGEAKYNILLKRGTLSPGVFHEGNVTGGIISFCY